MQIKLTIAVAAAAFALLSVPASAGEMPSYGTKNFTAPGDVPSYFTSQSGGASARGPDTAAAPAGDEIDDATASDVPVVKSGTGRHGKHASAGKSGKHASGKSTGYGGTTHSAKTASSKSAGTASLRATTKSTASRNATQSGASKTGGTKRAKSGIGQNAAVVSPSETPRAPVA